MFHETNHFPSPAGLTHNKNGLCQKAYVVSISHCTGVIRMSITCLHIVSCCSMLLRGVSCRLCVIDMLCCVQCMPVPAGIANVVPSHAACQQSFFFLNSNQQPLFMATFDMPPEAHPPPSLRPFYDHLQLQGDSRQLSQNSPWSCSSSPWA